MVSGVVARTGAYVYTKCDTVPGPLHTYMVGQLICQAHGDTGGSGAKQALRQQHEEDTIVDTARQCDPYKPRACLTRPLSLSLALCLTVSLQNIGGARAAGSSCSKRGELPPHLLHTGVHASLVSGNGQRGVALPDSIPSIRLTHSNPRLATNSGTRRRSSSSSSSGSSSTQRGTVWYLN